MHSATGMHALDARLALRGPEALSDAELLAFVCAVSLEDSQRALDGDASTAQVKLEALLAFARRRDLPRELPTVGRATQAAALLRDLASSDIEELHALALDSRNRLLRRTVVARGAANQVMATAREVFRPLIAVGAARAIVAHNHPSGDASPSVEDRELTIRLAAAGALLGVPVVDHLIVARGGFYSFADADAVALRPTSRRKQRS